MITLYIYLAGLILTQLALGLHKAYYNEVDNSKLKIMTVIWLILFPFVITLLIYDLTLYIMRKK